MCIFKNSSQAFTYPDLVVDPPYDVTPITSRNQQFLKASHRLGDQGMCKLQMQLRIDVSLTFTIYPPPHLDFCQLHNQLIHSSHMGFNVARFFCPLKIYKGSNPSSRPIVCTQFHFLKKYKQNSTLCSKFPVQISYIHIEDGLIRLSWSVRVLTFNLTEEQHVTINYKKKEKHTMTLPFKHLIVPQDRTKDLFINIKNYAGYIYFEGLLWCNIRFNLLHNTLL